MFEEGLEDGREGGTTAGTVEEGVDSGTDGGREVGIESLLEGNDVGGSNDVEIGICEGPYFISYARSCANC